VVDAGSEGKESESDAGAQAGEGSGAVAFEPELAFAGLKGRLDPLADGAKAAVAARFVFAVGAQERRSMVGHELLEFPAGEVLVGDHRVPGDRDAVEHLGRDDSFADVRAGQFPADRHPVACGDQVEPETPEPAAVLRQ